MTDNTSPTSGQAVDSASAPGIASPTAGQLLREARQARGMDLSELAQVLKVPERKLEALECDRYADLQSMTFVRALALSACRVLRADAAPVLALLPQQTQVEVLDPVSTGLNRPLQEFGRRRLWGGMLSEQRAGLAVTLIFVLGAALLWALPKGWVDQLRARVNQPGGAPTTVVEEPVAAPAPLAEPIASDRLPASGVPSWPASTPSGLTPPVALPGAVSIPPVPSAPARSASAAYRSASGAWGARSSRSAASVGGAMRGDTSSPAVDKAVAPAPAPVASQ